MSLPLSENSTLILRSWSCIHPCNAWCLNGTNDTMHQNCLQPNVYIIETKYISHVTHSKFSLQLWHALRPIHRPFGISKSTYSNEKSSHAWNPFAESWDVYDSYSQRIHDALEAHWIGSCGPHVKYVYIYTHIKAFESVIHMYTWIW